MGWVIGIIVVVAIVLVAIVLMIARAGSRPDETTPGPGGIGSDRSSPRSVVQQRFSSGAAHAGRGSRPAFGIRWFGPDTELAVAGFSLKAPCVYASSGDESDRFTATDPSEILLQAPIRPAHRPPPELGYWPWYSRIDPEHRHEYLSWLSSGRSSLPSHEGYLFLFFYGIERRLLVDECDRAWGLQEVVRLRKLDLPRIGTSDGRSFRSYSTGLLWFELARTPERFDRRAFDRVVSFTERWTPELMTAPLAWLAVNEVPLPASIARLIAGADPTSQRSVVTRRIPKEFNDLFDTRYHEAHGALGMPLKVSKRATWHTYRPASGGLGEMRVQVPNPMGIRSQFKGLPLIWNSCVTDLRRLSRLSASVDGGKLTIDAWEALPEELRVEVDHPITRCVSAIIDENRDAGGTGERTMINSGIATVAAGRLAELLSIARRPRLTATQSRRLATTLEYAGYGLIPDARLTPIRYGWDEVVALIPGTDGGEVDSARYNAAACVLRLGLAVALADGHADDVELRMLTDHIDAAFDLSPEEQHRISALRDLLITTGADLRPIARRIEEMLPVNARRRVGRLLVVIAAATNGIDRDERTALRRAFRALDLPPELLEETIAEVSPGANEAEAFVKPAHRGARAEEPISRPPSPDGFRLNHAAISSIMAETREVSAMLAEAMGAADAEAAADLESDPAVGSALMADSAGEPPSSGETPGTDLEVTTEGPGGRYQAFYLALLQRDRWDRFEADALARSFGLMLDAGLEVINDWSYDALGAPLIEDDGDELALDRSLIDQGTIGSSRQ